MITESSKEVLMWTLTIFHLSMVVLFFISFITFVFVTRGRRPISNILAWLFFMFILPYVGIPLFMIIGQRKLGWVLRKKRMLSRDKPRAITQNSVEHLMNSFNVMQASNNNSCQLFDDGIKAYESLIAQLQSATHSILISMYILRNDKVGRAVVKLLTEKAQQGLQVCVLLDTVGCLFMYPRRKLSDLRKAGAAVRYTMPLLHTPFRGRVNLRDHRKIIIIDGKTAIIGGMNLANEYMGPTENKKRWADLNMQLTGHVVNDLLAVFESDWEFAASKMEYKTYVHPEPPPIASSGNATMQIVASGPDTIGDRLYDAILAAIFNAKTSITIITPYFVIDDALQKAFLIALRRGVELNIILPRRSNHPVTDLVRSISLRKLQAGGAKCWFYPSMIHAKGMLFDQQLAVVGSANFDLRSLLLNFEISCFIYSHDEILSVESWMRGLQNACSTDMKKPSLFRMWLEDAAQLMKPLL